MKRCPHLRFTVAIAATLCMLFAVSAFAQFQTGNLYGKVQAKDGSVLPGVTVTLTGIGAPQTTVSDVCSSSSEGRRRRALAAPSRSGPMTRGGCRAGS